MIKGTHHTKESKVKSRLSHLGKKNPKLGITQTGRIGKLSNSYKHGKSKEYNLIRGSKEFKKWRYEVKKLYDWTCLNCGARCGNGKRVYIIAHHIKSFSEYPELRFATDNGITLCDKCHG